MEGQELEDAGASDVHGWGVDEDTSPRARRFASGTSEVAPLSPLSIEREAPNGGLPHEDVARIVHDFKGPLATIGLEAELLGENIASGTARDNKPCVDRILRNVAFLDRMVMNLLDRCMLDTGRFELRRVPTELRTLLEAVIDRVVATRDRERVFLDAREAVIVDIDDLRIERVVANLIANALEYAPAGTGVIVKLERERELTRVSVIDAGHDLTSVELANIFDDYRRGERTTSREGTGIGLSLSKQIIEAHGATFAVDSIRGEGTRFYFELPTSS